MIDADCMITEGGGCRGAGIRPCWLHSAMTENPERASTVGATGGLPGANADPRTAEVAADELASTLSGQGLAGAGEGPGDVPEEPSTQGELDLERTAAADADLQDSLDSSQVEN